MKAMATETFIGNMRGPVIGQTNADYDGVRSLYNGMIDKSPVMIARCTDVADVVTAVNFAKQNDLPVAIRGGGHSGPGLSSIDDGLMIDMSLMKGVRVNSTACTVRVGPDCTQGDVDHATHIYGLAVPAGIVSTTGIAGLTLGGGTGYLTRKYGLTIDNLLEADVVLADGRIVTANKSENADLYWGLRGGGGNFGIVTSLFPTGTASAIRLSSLPNREHPQDCKSQARHQPQSLGGARRMRTYKRRRCIVAAASRSAFIALPCGED